MTGLQQELIERVTEGLDALGMPQSWLAVRAGYSDKHVSMMLNGHVEGSITAWDRLLSVLAMTEAELVP